MKVLLLILDSFYQNSLALEYIRLYALEEKLIKRRADISVLVFPPEAGNKSINKAIRSDNPDLIGFSTFLWNIKRSLSVAEKVKGISPGIKVILGGVEVSYNPQKVMMDSPFIDAIVTGEGEIPFRHLLRNFLSDKPFGADIPGIWHRMGKEIISGGPNQCVRCLDEIPSPFLSSEFELATLTGDVLYETYRGCAFKCSYCLYHRHAGKPRFYSVNRIRKDLDVILKSPCRHIRIIDSTFNIDKRRTKEILKTLKGTDKKISVEMSAEFFDEEMVELCAKAGIRHIDIGLQSATDRVLKVINRTWHDKKAFRNNILLLSRHPEITLNLELICGLPEETHDSFKASLDKAVGYRPDHISVYRLQVIEGSALRNSAEKYGIKYMPEPPYSVIETASMSKEALNNMELLLFSNIVLYNTGIARLALRITMKRYRLRPTQIYEMFTGYCLRKKLYSEKEMRTISNHYAVGNRFDRPLPSILSLDYLKEACSRFFSDLARQYDDSHFRPIFAELVDYGYNLASLDNLERRKEESQSAKELLDSHFPSLSGFSVLRKYSSDFFQTLKSARIKLASPDPYGIAFFIHNRLGPVTLTLGKDLYKFLTLCDGTHTVEDLLHRLDTGSDLSPRHSKYQTTLQTISDLRADLHSIGLLN